MQPRPPSEAGQINAIEGAADTEKSYKNAQKNARARLMS